MVKYIYLNKLQSIRQKKRGSEGGTLLYKVMGCFGGSDPRGYAGVGSLRVSLCTRFVLLACAVGGLVRMAGGLVGLVHSSTDGVRGPKGAYRNTKGRGTLSFTPAL